MKGLITSFKVGHLEASWAIRLKSKAVFEELWGTAKLWSSIDAVAIGRPPEDGVTEFAEPGSHWLHVDQGAHKEGLHAYQGGVYLENTDCDDWCFQAILGSHKYHQAFCNTFPNAVKMSTITDFYPFEKPGEIKWFEDRGCQVKRIPAPKGSIVIWDSRTVHANIRPIKGRQHPGRWRYVTMVSMTPAAWATQADLESRREAYNNLKMTTHWSSQDVNVLGEYDINQVNTVTELPSNARSREARLLAGDLEYAFEDGESNGPEKPKWNTGHREGGWFSWCNII
ncbi:uncharacterized protein LOC112042773 [Lingula anatina]|uniref:Uncharacterized protein LOC112042773 n=1 Tax=Lingula anatina TaxID=7574 RepID=A0A2R2MU65_LINAN|nr:uncharacterized protein LOC112042773 [Lingula anatina]|eukprot:XP_023933707.1 uncharacterized protein LOC112042773 [Lingula anatina]